MIEISATAPERLMVRYLDGAVYVARPCGSEASIAADDVNVLMSEVKAFIGGHSMCPPAGLTVRLPTD